MVHMSIEQDIATILAKVDSIVGKELEEAGKRIIERINDIIVWELNEARRNIRRHRMVFELDKYLEDNSRKYGDMR